MADPNQSVRTCILKVDLRCCTGCQNKAKMKLQSISGVSQVEYNQEKGILTVTGDVEPMTLVHKLTKWGRKAELVSVKYQLDDLISDNEEDTCSSSSADTSSVPDPKPMERETMQMVKKKKKGLLRKYLFLGCLSKNSEVVQPLAMRNRNWHVPSKFENGPPGFGFPFANAATSSWQQPPFPMMMPYPSMMQQLQPQVPMRGATMPLNSNMFPPGPPPTQPPYFLKQSQTVNPKLHYQ